MSQLKYDPVHDPSNDPSNQDLIQDHITDPIIDKISISSLLANETDELNEFDDDDKTLSKRVQLSNKRKFKIDKPLKRRRKENKDKEDKLVSNGMVYKSKHLKKPDSEPLWRLDIQHDFLQNLLTNNLKIFQNPFSEIDEDIKYWSKISDQRDSLGYNGKLTFFQLYLLSILKSNRISKILKDRLISDLNYAFKFIILCLLVNFGRLNTTINFDYEMRSQLRTYHCIPVLQIHHDIFGIASEPEDVIENNGGGSGYTLNSVKQLQDTPRLKTILKSVADFNNQLHGENFDIFIQTCKLTNSIPLDNLQKKFNLVSLIFAISQFEEQIMDSYVGERKFENDKKCTIFYEIFNFNNIKPENKVNRFLWLVYLFTNTDLTREGNLSNPFGELVDGENKIPNVEIGVDTDYNQDTKDELIFADEMKLKRKNFLEIVENLSDNLESITKDGKVKLNKKGRKKRIINNPQPAQAPRKVKNGKVKAVKLSGDEKFKDVVFMKFIKEYLIDKVGKLHQKRLREGNLKYFMDVGDFNELDDYNEWKLSYFEMLQKFNDSVTGVSDSSNLINDLF